MIGTLLTIAAVGGFGYYWAKDKVAHAKSVSVTLKLDAGSVKEEEFLKLYHENKDKFYAMRIRIGESFFRYSFHQQNEYRFGIDEENLPLIKEFIAPKDIPAEDLDRAEEIIGDLNEDEENFVNVGPEPDEDA